MKRFRIVCVLLLVHISRSFSSGCSPQYTEYSGHCYKVHETRLNFTEARRTCLNEGGDLVSINSQAEDNFLIEKLKSFLKTNYWIGMEYVAGKYQWFDGSEVTYTHWLVGDSYCMHLTANPCFAMYSIVHSDGWLDNPPDYKEPFICEYVPGVTTTVVEPKTGCPSQYTEYSGHCYKVQQQNSSFTESRHTCQNEGGDLVSINSQAEDNFLFQKYKSSIKGCWIGMEYVMGKYQWVDGSAVSYTNWGNGEPNCMNNTKHSCSALYSSLGGSYWEDAGNSRKHCLICELVPVATTTDLREAIHLECQHLGWYVTVDLTKLSLRPSDVTEIHMNEDTCTGTVQGDLLVFNQTYNQCDTRTQFTNGKFTFNNYLVYAIRDSDNVIRDFRWKEDLHCSHDLHASGTVNVKPNITLQGSSSGNIPGSFFDISLFTDSAFRQPLHGTVKLGSPVYVQVLSLSPPDVVMVVDSCQADITASSSHNQKPFQLIQHHCSVESTTNIIAVRNQVTRFKFDMFDLPNDHDGIYVTCDVVFCDPWDFSAPCEQSCKTGTGSGLVG